MKTASSTLVAFLLSKQKCFVADLYTFSLFNGNTYTWTTSDQPIVANGVTYSSVGPALTRSRWAIKNTIEVPAMDIALLSNGTDFGGQNIKLLIHNGLLDGAYIQLNRAYMPTYGDTSLGTPLMFGGRTSTVQIGAKGAKITVKGDNVIMQQYIPRNVYNLSCIHTLYDIGCAISPGGFTVSNTVGAGSNAVVINWGSGVPANPTQYALGYITMTSGAAEGEIRTILGGSTNGVALAYPFYQNPSVGDTFNVTFGCDRQQSTCVNVFNNLQHYRGFPFIPPAELGA